MHCKRDKKGSTLFTETVAQSARERGWDILDMQSSNSDKLQQQSVVQLPCPAAAYDMSFFFFCFRFFSLSLLYYAHNIGRMDWKSITRVTCEFTGQKVNGQGHQSD